MVAEIFGGSVPGVWYPLLHPGFEAMSVLYPALLALTKFNAPLRS